MPLDKFGHSFHDKKYSNKFQQTNSLKFTVSGDVDMENLRICNVKEPLLNNDVVNKEYLEKELANIVDQISIITKDSLIKYFNQLNGEVAVIKDNVSKFKDETIKLIDNNSISIKKDVDEKLFANNQSTNDFISAKCGFILTKFKELESLKKLLKNKQKSTSTTIP